MSNLENNSQLKARQMFIITAAKACFSRSGFHGASMSDISRESGLGAGQLYRCFNSKELLVNETIKNIVRLWREFLQKSLSLKISIEDIVDTKSTFWQGWSSQNRCLLIEVYSEASRNKCVRSMLAQEEKLLIKELGMIFQNKMPATNLQQRTNRIDFLLMLIDGVACRSFEDNSMDKAELTRLTGILTRHLLC